MSAIIVYFSRTGENYVSGAIKKLDVGNTEAAAEMLQKLTGDIQAQIRGIHKLLL